jgi:hypothetical protein
MLLSAWVALDDKAAALVLGLHAARVFSHRHNQRLTSGLLDPLKTPPPRSLTARQLQAYRARTRVCR